jgi:formylglycine-generating enzyme required for sulfatase activity
MNPFRELPRLLTNAVGMKLVLVPAGAFLMGAPEDEPHRSADEGPPHRVNIKRAFYAGVYPVTEREFTAVTGYNPTRLTRRGASGPEYPVCGVSWEEAMGFCEELSRLPAEEPAGRVYQLPTEAEWEYACRAGTRAAFAFGASLSSRQANFNGNYPYGDARGGPFLGCPSRVGSYAANAWGLFDMHGNVWEWCNGYYYDEEHYRTAPRREEDDRPGGKPADPRTLRGGCWNSRGWRCRSADRYRCTPGAGNDTIGFRVIWQVG